MIVPRDARDLIVGYLDVLFSYQVSITKLFNRWAATRTTDQQVDWAEIDTYVSLLTNRYVEWEEVDVRAGGDRRTAWLPRAFRSRRFGTEGLPPARDYEDAGEFDAANATTTLDKPAYNKGAGRLGDSLPVDNVERAALNRRAFEEYKAAACCIDEIAAPNAVENLGAFWALLVTDKGEGEGNTVKEVGYDLLSTAPGESGIS
ncbi:hypothetical protein ACJJTC_015002 [Scirpophaga incertulas]